MKAGAAFAPLDPEWPRERLDALLDKLGSRVVLVRCAWIGDDAYISNEWYGSRDNVSTWLYEAVHLSGVAHLRDHGENRGHGDALLAVSEARLPKQPWDLTQMEPGKREAMLAGIRVIDLVVGQIEGQSKLNQHKREADHVAVVNRLAHAAET